jgi:hypothetical protein
MHPVVLVLAGMSAKFCIIIFWCYIPRKDEFLNPTAHKNFSMSCAEFVKKTVNT